MNQSKLDFREIYIAFENNEPRLCVYNNNKNKIRFLTSRAIKYLSDVEFVSPIVSLSTGDNTIPFKNVQTSSLDEITRGHITESQTDVRLLCLKDDQFTYFKKLKGCGNQYPALYFIKAEEKLVKGYNKAKKKSINKEGIETKEFFGF